MEKEQKTMGSLSNLHLTEKQQEMKHEEKSTEIRSRPGPPRSLTKLEEMICYNFKNKELLLEAFTHASYKEDDCRLSYERLEYLGDSVLNHLIAKLHFTLYNNMQPGELTRLRAANVDKEALARVALKYELHSYLWHKKPHLDRQIQEFKEGIVEYHLHSHGMIDRPKVLADILESLIGAIYVDTAFSMDETWKVVNRLLHPLVTPENLMKHPVVKFYEACQKVGLKPHAKYLWNISGQIEIYINNELIGRGKYKFKKMVAMHRAVDDAYNNFFDKIGNKDGSTGD